LEAAGAWEFALGFIFTTALLHAAGIAAGLAMGRFGSRALSRLAGAATALGGLWLALGA
jgi:urease accessory protein